MSVCSTTISKVWMKNKIIRYSKRRATNKSFQWIDAYKIHCYLLADNNELFFMNGKLTVASLTLETIVSNDSKKKLLKIKQVNLFPVFKKCKMHFMTTLTLNWLFYNCTSLNI